MKKITLCIVLSAIFAVLFAQVSFAADVDAVSATGSLPSWFPYVYEMICKLPYIGPYVAQVAVWIGVLGGFLTAVSVFISSIALGLRSVLKVAGLDRAADWVKNLNEKVQPWIKWFSTRNSEVPAATIKAALLK